MVQQVTPETTIEVIYPESDGQPMADNTEQFTWIVKIKENLEILFASQADVFIVGDLFWYPVQGNPNIKQAPDTMVVFGRPKGKRGFYLQWVEDNIAPQVVFEILSPGKTLKEMTKKLQFYQRHGTDSAGFRLGHCTSKASSTANAIALIKAIFQLVTAIAILPTVRSVSL